MAKNNIELSIGSTFDGEGFTKLNTALKTSGGNIRRVSGSVGRMLGQFEGMPGTLGKATRAVGGLLGGLMQFGPVGLTVAAAVGAFKLIIGPLQKIQEETKQLKENLDRMNNAWKTAEGRAAAFQKRVQMWKDAEAERDEKAKEAAAARKRAQEAENKAIDERVKMEREYDQYLMKTSALKERIAGLSEDQIAVNSAQRQVAFAQKWGGQMDREEAQLQLDLAKKKASDAFDALADEILQQAKDFDDQAAAEKKAKEAEKERAEKEKQIAAEKDAMAKKVKDLDERIAAAKKEAADLEANAARARGKSVGAWLSDERKLQREQQKEERQQANRVQNAETELARLVRMSPKARNAWQNQRIKDLREWLVDQDPNNNPKLKEAERLEKEKTDLIAKTQRDIANIAKTIQDNT